jgi:hypothetical protein
MLFPKEKMIHPVFFAIEKSRNSATTERVRRNERDELKMRRLCPG